MVTPVGLKEEEMFKQGFFLVCRSVESVCPSIVAQLSITPVSIFFLHPHQILDHLHCNTTVKKYKVSPSTTWTTDKPPVCFQAVEKLLSRSVGFVSIS